MFEDDPEKPRTSPLAYIEPLLSPTPPMKFGFNSAYGNSCRIPFASVKLTPYRLRIQVPAKFGGVLTVGTDGGHAPSGPAHGVWAEAGGAIRAMADRITNNTAARSFSMAFPFSLVIFTERLPDKFGTTLLSLLYSRYGYFVKPFLVTKRIYDFAVCVQQFHYFVLRTPHGARSSQIHAPSISEKICIISMCVYAPAVIQILSDE